MPGSSPPVVTMEVAFDTDPLTRPGPGDWTDITDAGDDSVGVRSLSTRRGARTKTGQVVPGSASALVDYPGRVLEPFYDGSPWFPNVDLRKRVRWLVDPDGSGAVVLWTGFIDKLPPSWRREVATANLSAVGLLSLVAGVRLPPSVLHVVMTDLDPDAWWPLADAGSTRADNLMGPNDGGFALVPSVRNPGVVPWGGVGSTTFTPATDTQPGQKVNITALPWTTHERSVVFWLRLSELDAAVDLPLWAQFSGTNVWRLAIQSGTLHHDLKTGANGFTQLGAFEFSEDTNPHLIVATVNAASGVEELVLYLDGVLAELQVPTSETGSPNYETLVESFATAVAGFDAAAVALAGADGQPFDMGHLAVFDRVLTASEVEAIWEAGAYAWSGDTTGERLDRILDLAGVDAGDRDIDIGTQICGPAVLNGQTAGSYIPKIAQTEGGPIFELATGEIAFRAATANNPTPALVFSDDPDGDSGTAYLPIEMDYSLTRLVNTATVSRDGSDVAVVVANGPSVEQYGTFPATAAVLHGTAGGARRVGARLVIRSNRPRLAIEALTVSSRHIDEVDPAVSLGAEIADAATLFARPPGGGDPIEQLLLVESVAHAFPADGRWTTAFGVYEHVVLPCFSWGVPDAGWGESAWCEQ